MTDACRSCEQPIIWARTEKNKPMPVDPTEVSNGNLILTRDDPDGPWVAHVVRAGEGTHVSHFATCYYAKEWRKR